MIEEQIKDLMSETLMTNENDSVKVLKQIFRACLDVENKKKYLDEAYHSIVKWGLLDQDTENFDWLYFLQIAREHGLGYDLFLDVSVVENVAGNGNPILRVKTSFK